MAVGGNCEEEVFLRDGLIDDDVFDQMILTLSPLLPRVLRWFSVLSLRGASLRRGLVCNLVKDVLWRAKS